MTAEGHEIAAVGIGAVDQGHSPTTVGARPANNPCNGMVPV